MFAENAEDNEDVGRRFVEYDSDYAVPETVVDFVECIIQCKIRK